MPSIDDPLVSTQWLADHLGDADIKVIDASYKMPGVLPLPSDDFLIAHIPGAVFFDVNAIADHNDPRPHMYPNAEQFARDVAALGISSTDTIVVYDAGTWMASARAWWMLLSFGHANVRVLDGGLKKWKFEGRAVEAGAVTKPEPGKFRASLDPSHVRNKAQLIENLTSKREQLIDARPQPRFEGGVVEPWPGRRSGHIPGSRSVPHSLLIDAAGTMKSTDELRAAFAQAGVDISRPLVTTCGSGVSAAVLTLALYRIGVRGSALYDGSWAEWGMPDGPEIATGPA